MSAIETPVDWPMRSRVRNLLEDLGDSPSEVARYLACLSVRGAPGNASDCAIAQLLRATVGVEHECRRVRVFRRSVVLTTDGILRWSVVRLPRPVRVFVSAFDAGAYPELIRKGDPEWGAPAAHRHASAN